LVLDTDGNLVNNDEALDAINSTIPASTTYNSSTRIWNLGNTSILNGETIILTLAATTQSIII
jgi:hypothetical protein